MLPTSTAFPTILEAISYNAGKLSWSDPSTVDHLMHVIGVKATPIPPAIDGPGLYAGSRR